ncbi:glycosyltransferase [Micromonospora zingiberis]|uniref:Glycosyltransferase n=1 Tax=Micromonospora zingiberis TaxID=2053011 RepID=A0A4R0GKJ4_9ACTN|nr:glycosyltransferase family 4 protein [Micromonospora zingiberis]TCB95928.1 glycosyltransferase [Micromonospora zingiberis]
MTAPGGTRTPEPTAAGDSAAAEFRVLITVGCFEPGVRGGGPVRSVANIIDTAPHHVVPTLVTRDRDLGTTEPYPELSGRWCRRGRSAIFYLNLRRPAHYRLLWQRLRRVHFDLLYVNGIWSVFSLLSILALRLRLIRATAVLLAPRGECSVAALALNGAKKRAFLRLWRPMLRRLPLTWHASTQAEGDDIRAVFPWARVIVQQNQTAAPGVVAQPDPGRPGAPARLVFIGRISPMKNLDLAIAALAEASRPVTFDIYGPMEDAAYWARCEALRARLPAHVTVNYRGLLPHDDVAPTFARYDAFLFPTRGENFGHVIAESLSACCPVICSDRTPWSAVFEAGGGRVVRPLTVAGLAQEIERVAGMSAQERHRARLAAGAAYRQWCQENRDGNVLSVFAAPDSLPS